MATTPTALGPVFVRAAEIPAFAENETLNPTLVDQFHRYLQATENLHKRTVAQLRRQLKLGPDQILIIGSGWGDFQRIDLDFSPQHNVLQQANNLAINYIRFWKSPPVLERGQFETQAAYQQRLVKQQQLYRQLNQQMQVDLGRIEDATNFLTKAVLLNPNSNDRLNRFHYDADHAQLTLRFPLQRVTEDDLVNQTEPVKVLQLVVDCAPDLAQSMQAVTKEAYALGIIAKVHQQHYQLQRVVILAYTQLSGEEQFQPLAQFDPRELSLLSISAAQAEPSERIAFHQDQVLPVGLQFYQPSSVSNKPQ
ncbi:hypothetical protein VH98_04375 [Acinetobacter brisouii]|nr:hypothetical protein VH98_04375 [Acinetobacter brisouii]